MMTQQWQVVTLRRKHESVTWHSIPTFYF